MNTRRILLSQIDEPGASEQAAPYCKQVAERIAESVRAVGLLQPIGVRPVAGTDRYCLIFGRHRVGAVRDFLKEETIEAIVFEAFDDVDADMARLAENLFRNKLRRGEYLVAVHRWSKLYEAKYPDRVGPQTWAATQAARDARLGTRTETVPSFPKLVAEVTGQSQRTAERAASIARAFTEDQLRALDSAKATLADMTALAGVADVEVRGKAVDLVAGGVDASIAIARVTGIGDREDNPIADLVDPMILTLHDDEEAGFVAAVERFKTESGKKFPTWREVFRVVKRLGYTLPSTSDQASTRRAAR